MNTIEYIKNLEAVGVSRAQAEVQAQGLTVTMEKIAESIESVRKDIDSVRREVDGVRRDIDVKFESFRSDIDAKFATKDDLRHEVEKIQTEFRLVRSEMREMEGRLTIKLGSITVGTVAFFSAFTVFMEHFLK